MVVDYVPEVAILVMELFTNRDTMRISYLEWFLVLIKLTVLCVFSFTRKTIKIEDIPVVLIDQFLEYF